MNKNFPYNIIKESGASNVIDECEFDALYHANDGKFRGAFWFIIGSMQERTAKILLYRFRDNMTYSAISEEVDLSVERCRQLVTKGLREFRRKRNWEFLRNGVCEVYEKEKAEESRKQYEVGKSEVMVELLELLNNKAITVEQLRSIYIDNNKNTNPFLDMTIDEFAREFKLSIRTQNCIIRTSMPVRSIEERTPEEIVKLHRSGIASANVRWGIRTVRDLASLTDAEIRNIRNLGRKSYMELIHAMKLAGVEPKPANDSKESE